MLSVRFSHGENGFLGMRPQIVRITSTTLAIHLTVCLVSAALPLIREQFEQQIGQVDRWPKQRHGQHDRHRFVHPRHVSLVVGDGRQALRVSLDRRQYERGKDEREQGRTVDVRIGKRENYGQAESEAEVVRPAGLNMRYSLLDIPAHVAELVLERVQRVQKRQVYVTQELIEHAGRHQGHERALHEKYELHGAAEDSVSDDLGNGELLVDLWLAVLLNIGDVGDLLVTQHIEYLAQEKHRQNPDKGEEQLYARVQVVGD